jgi:hypothetical protein
MTCEVEHSTRAVEGIGNLDADYRAEFARVLGQLGLQPTAVAALVEGNTGRPFETCSPAHLKPVLEELLALVRSRSIRVDRSPSCSD